MKWIIQFHSINDPFISIDEARYIAKKLDTEYHECLDQGHFSSDVGKNEFPELLQALKQKLSKYRYVGVHTVRKMLQT